MFSQSIGAAKKLWAGVKAEAQRMFKRLTRPALASVMTGTLPDLPRSWGELVAENALLRQQLIVLRRQGKTPRLTWQEQLSLLFLARWGLNWTLVLQIIKPATLLRRHPARGPCLPRGLPPVLEVQVERARADAAQALGATDDCAD